MRGGVKINDKLGFKLSLQGYEGDDWEYIDPVEKNNRDIALNDSLTFNTDIGLGAELKRRLGRSPTDDEVAEAIATFKDTLKIGNRDFNLSRISTDFRLDFRLPWYG